MPGRTVAVIIPGTPPNGNALHRMTHWQVRASRQEWREATLRAVDLPEGWQPIRRCRVEVDWRFHVKRERDFDNLVAGLKPIIDGLVEAGVIAGDDTETITGIDLRSAQISGPSEIRIEIEETDG